MKDVFKRLLTSLKFWETIAGVVSLLATEFFPDVDDKVIYGIIGLFASLIGGQGLADLGKEKAKVEINGGS